MKSFRLLYSIALIILGCCQLLRSTSTQNQYDPTLNEKKIETKKDSISQTVLKIVNKAKSKVKLSKNKPEGSGAEGQSESLPSASTENEVNKQQINAGVCVCNIYSIFIHMCGCQWVCVCVSVCVGVCLSVCVGVCCLCLKIEIKIHQQDENYRI
jgi:hypothetical protein